MYDSDASVASTYPNPEKHKPQNNGAGLSSTDTTSADISGSLHELEKASPEPYITQPGSPPRQLPGASIYLSISSVLGFQEPYSLLAGFVLGGALVGFCLARTGMLSPKNVRTLTAPGEWFWYQKRLFKAPIFIHIYLIIFGGIIAVFQFIPAIRRRSILLHRINGYISILLIIPASICGTIVGRRAYGGELNIQSAFYFLGMGIVFAAFMGIYNVRRDTRTHRTWMLRMITYVAIPVTSRLTTLCARAIVSHIGTYYAVWRCDEILSVIGTQEAAMSYPACVGSGVDPSAVSVAVRAALHEHPLGYASSIRATFGMSLWIGMILHIIGVEFYIQMTEDANQHKRDFALERIPVKDDCPVLKEGRT